MKKKPLGDKISFKNGSWSFNNFSISKFDRHIEKSIPFYKDIHDLILSYSSFFIK